MNIPHIGDDEKGELAQGFAVIEWHERASPDGARVDLCIRYVEARHAGQGHHAALRSMNALLQEWYPGSAPPYDVPAEPEPPPPPPLPARVVRPLVGQVKAEGRSFGDASGPRLVHGYSDFALLPKWRENPDKAKREIANASRYQQYVRILWRLNGWMWSGEGTRWPNSGLTVDPIRDGWYDDTLREVLRFCHEQGLRVNLSTGDMNDWSAAQAEDGFRRTAQIAASVSADICWLGAAANELRGTMRGGESSANIAQCESLMRTWAQHYPWGMRSISDPYTQDKAGMRMLSGGNSTCALIHDVRWQAEDALRRSFNTVYENFPGKPVVQDEPTGPNGSPPPSDFARHVYQQTEDHDVLLALYTMHVLTGQASTYFNDPALVSREPIDSTWGFKELPAAWRAMEIPEDIGQGVLKPGHHDDAPLQVVPGGSPRADSMVRGGYSLGVISGEARFGIAGQATAYRAGGVLWERRVFRGERVSVPGATVIRIVQ